MTTTKKLVSMTYIDEDIPFELTSGLTGTRSNYHHLPAEIERPKDRRDWLDKVFSRDHHFPFFRHFVDVDNIEIIRKAVYDDMRVMFDPGLTALAHKIELGCEVWRGGAWPMVLWPDDRGAVQVNASPRYGVWKYSKNEEGWPLRAELHITDPGYVGLVYDPRGSYIDTQVTDDRRKGAEANPIKDANPSNERRFKPRGGT